MNITDIEKEFNKKFTLSSLDVEWYGDGHFCTHHPDDPAHTEECYKHPVLKDFKLFIRQAIKTAFEETRVKERTHIEQSKSFHDAGTWERTEFFKDGFNSALSEEHTRQNEFLKE